VDVQDVLDVLDVHLGCPGCPGCPPGMSRMDVLNRKNIFIMNYFWKRRRKARCTTTVFSSAELFYLTYMVNYCGERVNSNERWAQMKLEKDFLSVLFVLKLLRQNSAISISD
jgi:hypothetical protein